MTYGTSVSRHTLLRNHPASDASVIEPPLAYRSLSSTGWPFIAATSVSCATGASVSQASLVVATLRLTSAESRLSCCRGASTRAARGSRRRASPCTMGRTVLLSSA